MSSNEHTGQNRVSEFHAIVEVTITRIDVVEGDGNRMKRIWRLRLKMTFCESPLSRQSSHARHMVLIAPGCSFARSFAIRLIPLRTGWNAFARFRSKFKGKQSSIMSRSSTSHGRSQTCQTTRAFSAIHSDSAASPGPNVMRLPLPTRRNSSPS